jgi:hypothetical protein
MPQYEVVVRVLDVSEPDPVSARRHVEERLRAGGVGRWLVTSITPQGSSPPRVPAPPRHRTLGAQASYAGGSMLIAAVVAWALWFLWMLAE